MMLGLETVKPPNLDIIPTSANFTIPGQVKVYVLDSKSNATVLAFTLGSVSLSRLHTYCPAILTEINFLTPPLDRLCRCESLGAF